MRNFGEKEKGVINVLNWWLEVLGNVCVCVCAYVRARERERLIIMNVELLY